MTTGTAPGAGNAGATTTVKTWWPTRKWWVHLVTALGTFLTVLTTADWNWTDEVQIAAIALMVSLLTTYLAPNQDTPGGVPERGGPRL